MNSQLNSFRTLALTALAGSLFACAATTPAHPGGSSSSTSGHSSSSGSASSTTGATSSGATSSTSSTSTSTSSTSTSSSSTTTSTSTSSTSSGTTTGSTTGSTSGSTTGGGAACAACSGNSDCASNSCYQGYCDPVGLNCTSNSDCGTGTCAGDYCNCGGTTSGSTTTSTSSTSTSGGSTGSTAGACVACSANGDCASNSCYQGYCDPVGLKCTSNTDCGTGTCKSNGYCSCGGSTSSGSTSSTTTSGGTTTGSTTSGGTTSGTTGTTGSGWTGSVTAQGGQVSTLFFAAVGDARPPNEDDTSNYPTAIISQIYQDITAMNPEFVVSTGDYMFANPSGTQGQAQIDLYNQARRVYPGVEFAAMGNHECTGYTSSNCLSTSASNNYAAFMQTLIAPLGQTKPYYRFDVNDSNGQWTAKFIVLAMNSWDSTQASWLTTQMQQSTTYTFIIRHEPEAATTAPGVTPSDNIISQYPYTLKIVGHTHEFNHASTREVIVGNGGAPISYGDYGYALFSLTSSGDIQVQSMDYQSNAPVATFTVPK